LETINQYYLCQDDEIKSVLQDIPPSLPPIATKLVGAIRLANLRIYLTSQKETELRGMGTTASVISFDKGQFYIAHVGDSRVYLARAGHLRRLTEDHTWLNELIQDHEIDEAEAKGFEKKNVITRALGLSPTIKVDVNTDRVENGDVFLLCTDGLSDSLSDDTILEILSQDSEDLELSAVCLIAKAKELNGSDNITAILIKVEETESSSSSISPLAVTIPNESEQIIKSAKRILKRNCDTIEHKVKKSAKANLNNIRKFDLPIALATVIILMGLGYFLARNAFQPFSNKASTKADSVKVANDEINSNSQQDILDLAKLRGMTSSAISPNPGQNALIALVYYDDIEKFQETKDKLRGRVLDIVSVQPSELGENGGGYQVNIRDSRNRPIYTNSRLSLAQSSVPDSERTQSRQSRLETPATTPMMGSGTREIPRRSLASRSRNFGTVFLVGFNTQEEFQNADVIINNRYAGKLATFLRDGMRLQPGTYTIALRDSLGIIFQKLPEITISEGDVKLLEFQEQQADTTAG